MHAPMIGRELRRVAGMLVSDGEAVDDGVRREHRRQHVDRWELSVDAIAKGS